jgi:LysR family nitrogen assimilation transcriptional regulator
MPKYRIDLAGMPACYGPMDIRALRYFVAIAEAGSISKAAGYLRIAQPALSRHVHAIEEELGTSLLIRTPRGVTMTEGGEQLYSSALDILRQLDTLPDVIGTRGHVVTGRVVVGLPTSASAVLATPLLLAAMDRYPQVQIHLIESLSGFLREWVQTGRLDLAVLYDAQESPTLHVDPMLDEDLWLVGAPERLAELEAGVAFRDLSRFPLVMPGLPHSLRRLINDMALREGVRLTVAAEADSLHIVKNLAATGRTFSLLVRSAIWTELKAGMVSAVPIHSPTIRRSVSLARPLLRGRNRAAEEIARLCLSIAADLKRRDLWGNADTG